LAKHKKINIMALFRTFPAPPTISSIVLSLPTVTTTEATSITSTEVTTGGNVTSDGGAAVTARGVAYGTTTNPTISGTSTSDGSGTGVFTSQLSGLTPSTIYYVRAYATNAVGTAYGDQITFTTSDVYLYMGGSNG